MILINCRNIPPSLNHWSRLTQHPNSVLTWYVTLSVPSTFSGLVRPLRALSTTRISFIYFGQNQQLSSRRKTTVIIVEISPCSESHMNPCQTIFSRSLGMSFGVDLICWWGNFASKFEWQEPRQVCVARNCAPGASNPTWLYGRKPMPIWPKNAHLDKDGTEEGPLVCSILLYALCDSF